MGIFSKLLMAPLAPVTGVIWVAEQLEQTARRELHGPDAIFAQLSELERLESDGEISAAERQVAEEQLLAQLRVGRSGQ